MFRYQRKQGCRMGTLRIILACVLLTGCGGQQWRHGNYYHDKSTTNKREKHRDQVTQRAADYREGTAKHYINQHKKRDGKINLFIRDGFDSIF